MAGSMRENEKRKKEGKKERKKQVL